MMTVRFNTGFSIQYNNAGYVVRNDYYTDLYKGKNAETGKGEGWIAQVPTGECVVECVPACRTYDSTKQHTSTDEVRCELRSMNRRIAKIEKAVRK